MSHANHSSRFLEVMSQLERVGAAPAGRPGQGWPFVTLSRQAGAGGHTLAETLLKVMEQEKDTKLFRGWQVFDQLLCDVLLQDSRLHVSMQALLAEEYHSQVQEFISGLLGGHSDQYLMVHRLFETIRALAMVGKVIIVGRGGSQATKKLPLGVHIRLVAPEPVRVQRMMKLLSQSEDRARQTAQQQDRDRARLLKAHFQAEIDDPLLYDAVWNTGAVPFETIAESIVSLLKHRVSEAGAQAGV